MTWTITPLCCGVLEAVEAQLTVYGILRPGTIDIPILAWLLSEGNRHVLVDSGPTSPATAMARHGRTLNCSGGRTIQEQLSRHRISTEGIEMLLMTHLHWDHCGNNELFPGVPIYVQESEVRFAAQPIPTQFAPYAAFQTGNVPAWVASADRFVVLNGPHPITPGISALPLPGHTPGSQGFLVDTAAGRLCITGDLLDTYENWDGRLPSSPPTTLGIPPGIHTDLEAWFKSVALLRSMDIEVLPSHEWEVMERFGLRPDGREAEAVRPL